MITLSLNEITNAVNGKLLNCADDALFIDNISTDTRVIKSGDLFIALVGERFNAHDFLSLAQTVQAAAVIVCQETTCTLPTILVQNTRVALGQLAAYVKKQIIGLKSVAITGSNGKTTTKEMLASILNSLNLPKGAVITTAGNLNNEIGVPLTLFRLTKKTQFAVLELGANHLGEIAYTSNLVKPDIALINNVMPSHLEGFGSIEGVAKAKGEIWQSINEHSIAIVNIDADFSNDYLAYLQSKNIIVMTFSQQITNASVYATHVCYDTFGRATFDLNYQGKSIRIKNNLPGAHNVSNALAAASMGLALECGLLVIQQGLQNIESIQGRVNARKITDKIILIDDTYNANVASIKVAINLLNQCEGQSLLVLGDMAELGTYSQDAHQEIGCYAAEQGIDLLLTVGEQTLFTSQSFKQINSAGALHFKNKSDLLVHVNNYLRKYRLEPNHRNLTILVKGSRAAAMEDIVQGIN
ncbi:MAG: UDP-N-acetylmuramoyl-tripeptide--D-alanyl-D-alanine ligase [Psychromonas sp.]|nr:UDP-N-acetylmuramoyl-tripeptide--D-alanyl-D-alanine ligase [Psychromonas sp.]